jgi:hypothetical protein
MVHITDLHTIDRMHTAEPTPDACDGIAPSLLLKITSLSIVLKLPLHFYESLEKLERLEDALEDMSDDTRAWLRIDSTMRLFPNLKKLRIWFEHNDSCTWTVVNERVLVSPLTRLNLDKDIEMTLSLPKLHPKFAQDSRHYTSESGTPFRLHRRLRQNWHATMSADGILRREYKTDFPFFQEIIDFEDRTMGEVERVERSGWMTGMDMEEEVEILGGGGIGWNHYNM